MPSFDLTLAHLLKQVGEGAHALFVAKSDEADRLIEAAAARLAPSCRVIRVVAPSAGLSLSGLMAQLSGTTALDAQDDAVLEVGYRRLAVPDGPEQRIALLIQGAGHLRLGALRFLQRALERSPALVMVADWTPEFEFLLHRPELAGLRMRLLAPQASERQAVRVAPLPPPAPIPAPEPVLRPPWSASRWKGAASRVGTGRGSRTRVASAAGMAASVVLGVWLGHVFYPVAPSFDGARRVTSATAGPLGSPPALSPATAALPQAQPAASEQVASASLPATAVATAEEAHPPPEPPATAGITGPETRTTAAASDRKPEPPTEAAGTAPNGNALVGMASKGNSESQANVAEAPSAQPEAPTEAVGAAPNSDLSVGTAPAESTSESQVTIAEAPSTQPEPPAEAARAAPSEEAPVGTASSDGTPDAQVKVAETSSALPALPPAEQPPSPVRETEPVGPRLKAVAPEGGKNIAGETAPSALAARDAEAVAESSGLRMPHPKRAERRPRDLAPRFLAQRTRPPRHGAHNQDPGQDPGSEWERTADAFVPPPPSWPLPPRPQYAPPYAGPVRYDPYIGTYSTGPYGMRTFRYGP